MILNQLLSEELHPAVAVGYCYETVVLMNGVALFINGFNEKLPVRAFKVLKLQFRELVMY